MLHHGTISRDKVCAATVSKTNTDYSNHRRGKEITRLTIAIYALWHRPCVKQRVQTSRPKLGAEIRGRKIAYAEEGSNTRKKRRIRGRKAESAG